MNQTLFCLILALLSFGEGAAMITPKKQKVDHVDARTHIAEEVEQLITLQSSDGLDCIISRDLGLLSETLTLFKVVAILERLALLSDGQFTELQKYQLSDRQALASESELIKALHYLRIPIVVFALTDLTLEIVPLKKALRSVKFKGKIELEKLAQTVRLSEKS